MPKADPNDPVGRLNEVLANMQVNPPEPAMNANPGQFNTVNMGGGMNPFGGGGGQVASYNTSAAAASNPFGGPGPSLESW